MSKNNYLSSGDERMDRQFLFTAEIDKMTAVMRRTMLIDKSRRENDAEHLDKADREKKAADQLFGELPEDQGKMIRSLWEEFDAMETADAKYAACMDRLQPFLHNTLTDGKTWVESGAVRPAVEKRMEVVKEFMPRVYEWVLNNLDSAVERGWLAL